MKKCVLGKVVAVALTVATIIGCIGVKAPVTTNAAEVTGAGINVEKIDGIDDDFIMGMDVSSYVSVTNSGVVFKDFNGNALDDAGFFNLLKSCGINYIRIRVWNDPFDANGNGYGGGNCDIENAAVIGKLATNAGMKVLIDFHYSDFWADPAKQMVPKEWKGYTVDQKATAIYNYTKESLTYLKNKGVNIGMVQVGNETTSAFCGETDWNNMCKLFSAGSKAIREVDKSILIALHFTDPQKKRYNTHASYLKNNNVDYDVFASSFYPEWHGTMSNLTSQLKSVANTYGKKVMIMETSYPYSLDDFDGYDNTINKWTHDDPPISGYPKVSVQGQADYMASVIKAMADLGDAALGVCYWEGAWNSVGNPYVGAGGWTESVRTNNKKLWEQYGSGWATSYASEYDPDDAGQYYGGCSVDNQTFFDVNGKALASLNVFNYVKTGATTEGTPVATTSSLTTTTKNNEVATTTKQNEVVTTAKDNEVVTTTKDNNTEATTSKVADNNDTTIVTTSKNTNTIATNNNNNDDVNNEETTTSLFVDNTDEETEVSSNGNTTDEPVEGETVDEEVSETESETDVSTEDDSKKDAEKNTDEDETIKDDKKTDSKADLKSEKETDERKKEDGGISPVTIIIVVVLIAAIGAMTAIMILKKKKLSTESTMEATDSENEPKKEEE